MYFGHMICAFGSAPITRIYMIIYETVVIVYVVVVVLVVVVLVVIAGLDDVLDWTMTLAY